MIKAFEKPWKEELLIDVRFVQREGLWTPKAYVLYRSDDTVAEGYGGVHDMEHPYEAHAIDLALADLDATLTLFPDWDIDDEKNRFSCSAVTFYQLQNQLGDRGWALVGVTRPHYTEADTLYLFVR